MVKELAKGDQAALEKIESYHQAHYYKQLTDCVACLFGQSFTSIQTKIWNAQIRQLYQLNENFLDDIVDQMQAKEQDGSQSASGSIVSWIGQAADFTQNILPFNLGHTFFTAPIFESIRIVSQVTEFVFTFNLHDSITRFLVNQFKIDSNQDHAQAELDVSQSLEKNHPLGEKIADESRILSHNLLKLFMFREILLEGKLTNNDKERAIKQSFLKRLRLEKEKKDKINAIVGIYYIEELNHLFEHSFKRLFQLQQKNIKQEQNECDHWLSRLFETTESRHIFSRQIQLHFLQATRDFFVIKQNEKSVFGKHPYFYSIAIGLTISLLAISTIALVGPALATLPFLASGISAFAITFTASILIITKINRVYYARSKNLQKQIQYDIDILNQNISHVHHQIENSKLTAKREKEWLNNFQTIRDIFFGHKHILLGFHEAWVREFAARYRYAKNISNDLKKIITQLIDKSKSQSQMLITSLQRQKFELIQEYIKHTTNFLKHGANRSAIKTFELRLKMREQLLYLVSNLDYTPPHLMIFYTDSLKGLKTDLSHIRYFNQLTAKSPYNQICLSAQRLYHQKEEVVSKPMRFHGDADYRQLLKLPNLSPQRQVKPCDISTYLRNSLQFLLSLAKPIKPEVGADPLKKPLIPTGEFFLYRLLWFRQLAKLYEKNSQPDDISNRLYIESFVKRIFNLPVKAIFDNILNQAYYLPKDGVYPTITINKQAYAVEQLEYIAQSLTLDFASHTTELTPQRILTYFGQVYQDDALERKDPVKLIALNISKSDDKFVQQSNDFLVQQSKAFEEYITKYIDDTQGFIHYLQLNSAPKAYIDCYQFKVIEQLISLQVDIIVQTNKSGKQSEAYSLVKLWQKIDAFVSMQPYRIHHFSGLYRLLDLFRSNYKAIYPFFLPEEQMNDYKASIKKLLLVDQTKSLRSSMWASEKVSNQPKFEAPPIKNL